MPAEYRCPLRLQPVAVLHQVLSRAVSGWASITKISGLLAQIPKMYFLLLSGMGVKVKVPANMFRKSLLAVALCHDAKKLGVL